MKNHYTKPKGWGAYTPQSVIDSQRGIAVEGHKWARPLPYTSLIERLQQAWDVLTYKADALYWKERDEV